jgi:hypothetical protein
VKEHESGWRCLAISYMSCKVSFGCKEREHDGFYSFTGESRLAYRIVRLPFFGIVLLNREGLCVFSLSKLSSVCVVGLGVTGIRRVIDLTGCQPR